MVRRLSSLYYWAMMMADGILPDKPIEEQPTVIAHGHCWACEAPIPFKVREPFAAQRREWRCEPCQVRHTTEPCDRGCLDYALTG